MKSCEGWMNMKSFLKKSCVILLTAFMLIGCSNSQTQNNNSVNLSGELKIDFIDVGQGDSILVRQNGHNMLIDTGTNASTEDLISYLNKNNIKTIDYLVLTHPHEDHIGGADAVIRKFKVNNIYMPKVSTSTKTFRDVLRAMKLKGLKASEPELQDIFKVGDAKCTVYGPVSPIEGDLNTYSIVLKLTYGSTSFLFTGDAQASNEKAMIERGYDLRADVLKLGHHGSRTSTSKEFLEKVNPKYAVLSCGKDNDYGHPHGVTVNKLKNKNIPLYRTDEEGTIICTSDGKKISFNCKPGDYKYGRR